MKYSDAQVIEVVDALMVSLAHAIDLTTTPQLSQLWDEIESRLKEVQPDSAAAGAFRSVLREIAKALAARPTT